MYIYSVSGRTCRLKAAFISRSETRSCPSPSLCLSLLSLTRLHHLPTLAAHRFLSLPLSLSRYCTEGRKQGPSSSLALSRTLEISRRHFTSSHTLWDASTWRHITSDKHQIRCQSQ